MTAHKLPKDVLDLMNEFEKLPGVGSKSAARMIYYYLRLSKSDLKRMGDLFKKIAENITQCIECNNIAEGSLCSICQNVNRDKKQILIVEEAIDCIVFEEMGLYSGLYYVLGGLLSPVKGIGTEELGVDALLMRLKRDASESDIEIIFALPTNFEGEATVNFLKNKISSLSIINEIKLSTLARGIPSGADINYADSETLKSAFNSRNEV